MKLKLYILLILLIGTVSLKAADPVYSQYMFNRFLLNPADAGSEGYTAVNFTAREQWVGLPNSPKTHSLSFQTRLLQNSFISKATSLRKKFARRSKNGKVGVGFFLFNDINGHVRKNGFQGTYAYHITLRQSLLSFGLTTKVYQYKLVRDQIYFGENTSDRTLNSNDFDRWVPDLNFGAQYITPFYNVGLSINELAQSSLGFSDVPLARSEVKRTYNLTGGYKYEVNRFYMIEPTVLIKFSEAKAFQSDISCKVYYREDYWAGLSYRTGTFKESERGAFILYGGVRVDKFYFGYAFDYTLSNIMSHTLGSHEFMFSVKFGDNARRYRWLNRY